MVRFARCCGPCALALASLALASGHCLAEQQIGAAAVVVNNVTGTLAATRQRAVLRAGIDVFQNEIIETAENSASRVLFQDRTDLSIGPMSQVTLDRFVFDPSPSNSAVAISVAKGVARFSTGLLPKPDYQITTPSCAIGVRGTVLTIVVSAARASNVSVQEGSVSVSAQGVTVIVNAGQSTFVQFGQPPTQPAPSAPPTIANQMDALLQSPPPAAPMPTGGPPPYGPYPYAPYQPYAPAPGYGVPGYIPGINNTIPGPGGGERGGYGGPGYIPGTGGGERGGYGGPGYTPGINNTIPGGGRGQPGGFGGNSHGR